MTVSRRWPAYLAIALVAFSIGVAAGWIRWKKPAPSNYRSTVIREHARQFPPNGTLVIGDSLVERQRLCDICGPALNAGISGATSADLLELATDLIGTVKPRWVVLNVGTNDVAQKISTKQLEANVQRMISTINDAKVLVVGVPGGGQADDALRVAASRYGAAFIVYPVTDVTDTTDGLHLNAAGAAKWQAAVRAALCPRN
jgi:lysophospholipase L1-like esterase